MGKKNKLKTVQVSLPLSVWNELDRLRNEYPSLNRLVASIVESELESPLDKPAQFEGYTLKQFAPGFAPDLHERLKDTAKSLDSTIGIIVGSLLQRWYRERTRPAQIDRPSVLPKKPKVNSERSHDRTPEPTPVIQNVQVQPKSPQPPKSAPKTVAPKTVAPTQRMGYQPFQQPAMRMVVTPHDYVTHVRWQGAAMASQRQKPFSPFAAQSKPKSDSDLIL